MGVVGCVLVRFCWKHCVSTEQDSDSTFSDRSLRIFVCMWISARVHAVGLGEYNPGFELVLVQVLFREKEQQGISKMYFF